MDLKEKVNELRRIWERLRKSPVETKPDEFSLALTKQVKEAQRAWENAERLFQEAPPEMADMAILHWKSSEERYRYLLRQIRQINPLAEKGNLSRSGA